MKRDWGDLICKELMDIFFILVLWIVTLSIFEVKDKEHYAIILMLSVVIIEIWKKK